jgi:hypothetical protein
MYNQFQNVALSTLIQKDLFVCDERIKLTLARKLDTLTTGTNTNDLGGNLTDLTHGFFSEK